jgi:GNAT superfamily N-acetyltransferase
MKIRQADEAEIDALAQLWYDGWQDAHAHLLPAELSRLRTRESFFHRLQAALERVRVAGPPGEPLGFSIVKPDELYQLYVSAQQRGAGMAAALLADAEAALAADGTKMAWLKCAIGNLRAATFYEKHGWQRAGLMTSLVETSEGPFPLEIWRYEKRLA